MFDGYPLNKRRGGGNEKSMWGISKSETPCQTPIKNTMKISRKLFAKGGVLYGSRFMTTLNGG
jgi:hypothetical protein